MARSRYLVAYDIRDDRRLTQVRKCVEGFGFRLQYSVFLCDLSPVELIDLRTDLRGIIHAKQDSVVFVELGDPNGRGRYCFEFMGTHPRLPPPSGATVV